MVHLRRLLIVLAFGLMVVPGAVAEAQTPAPGVVRVVMFWMNGCPHCHHVLDEVLPPLQRQYGAQFEIQLIEVATAEDVDAMVAVAVAYGRKRDATGVPLLLIGDQTLMGSQEIPARLPGLIEHYLSAGGVDWPSLAGPQTAEPLGSDGSLASASSGLAAVNGSGLAIVVLVGMVITLVWAAASLVRGLHRPAVQPPKWLDLAVPTLAVAGLGVAGYLAYIETQAVPAVCGPVGDCNAVQSSPYAHLFGVLPVGVLGLAGYLALLAAWAWPRLSRSSVDGLAAVAVFGLAALGVLFSLYLTFLEPFVIGAVCLWCLSSAVLITLLMAASLPPAVAVLAAKNQTRSRLARPLL